MFKNDRSPLSAGLLSRETDFTHQNYIVWLNLKVHLEGIELTVVLQNIACTVVILAEKLYKNGTVNDTSI